MRNVSLTGDITFRELTIKEPAISSAGLQGIKAALAHAQKETGIFKAVQTLSHMNQKDGFDCPGCAWPDPEKRSSLGEYCENGVKALTEEATDQKVDREFFAKYSVEEISRWSDYAIGKCGRITEPFILQPNSLHYEPISWEKAYAIIGKNLNNLPSPDDAIFYTSGRSSNEAAFLYGLFARAFGTNNMPDCSNMCHESSGVALKKTLGIGKGSVTLEDFYEAEVVMIIGQNPGTNHPRMLSALERCKENGGKIISVNPLKEAGLLNFHNPQKLKGMLVGGTTLTDCFLQVKVNQDVALLKLIFKKLLAKHIAGDAVFDDDFIKQKTAGFDAMVEDLALYNESQLLQLCGVPESTINDAVSILAPAKKVIICWAMGLTQHENAVHNIRECVNLLLAKGSIGKPGAGTCPVRGHSNVQGDRTVGIMHYVSHALNAAIKEVFGINPPEKTGYDTVHAIQAMHDKPGKVFIGLGGNFVSAASDTAYTATAMQNCRLTVQISTKLNRSHLVTGETAIILPTLGRSELDLHNGKPRFVTVENSMGKVHQSRGRNNPASNQLRSEPEIVGHLAATTLGREHTIPWLTLAGDYDLIREKISAVLKGFEDYNKRSANEGFYLPNNARTGDFSMLPEGKAQFTINKLSDHTLDDNEFLLTTIRSHDQFNTTIYDWDDRYRGIFNERRVVFMNPADMAKHGLVKAQVIDLKSNYGSIRTANRFKVIPYDIPSGNLAAYFPETNILVPNGRFAEKSHTPISKSIKVKIVVR